MLCYDIKNRLIHIGYSSTALRAGLVIEAILETLYRGCKCRRYRNAASLIRATARNSGSGEWAALDGNQTLAVVDAESRFLHQGLTYP